MRRMKSRLARYRASCRTMCRTIRLRTALALYGASNAYWHGQRATFETAYGTHHFRHYEATHLSFLDFARLIRSAYPRAYHFSFQPEAYAKEIAYSPYISEQNGDNRDLYRRNIIALEAEIGKQLELFQWTMNNGQLNHKS